MAVSALFILCCYKISGIPIKMMLKSIKPVIMLIVFTGVLNMLFVDGNVLFQFGFIRITDQGVFYAIVMAVRIICLIAGTTLLTYTTSPIVLTDGLERLMEPLNKLHVPVHEISMMMTIALRFIPTFIEETDKIMSAGLMNWRWQWSAAAIMAEPDAPGCASSNTRVWTMRALPYRCWYWRQWWQ